MVLGVRHSGRTQDAEVGARYLSTIRSRQCGRGEALSNPHQALEHKNEPEHGSLPVRMPPAGLNPTRLLPSSPKPGIGGFVAPSRCQSQSGVRRFKTCRRLDESEPARIATTDAAATFARVSKLPTPRMVLSRAREPQTCLYRTSSS